MSLGVGGDCGAGGVAGTGEGVFSDVFLGVCAVVEGFSAAVVFCEGAGSFPAGLEAGFSFALVAADFPFPVPCQWLARAFAGRGCRPGGTRFATTKAIIVRAFLKLVIIDYYYKCGCYICIFFYGINRIYLP